MHIKITKAVLLDVLNKVQKAVPSKAALQILQNALIVAKEGKIVVTGSSLDITIIADTNCEVLEDGETTLPVKMLAMAISKCNDGTIDISVDANDKATVTAGSTVFRILGMKASEFPMIDNAEGTTVSIKSDALREMFRKVKYAASIDGTRQALASVLVEFEEGRVTAVATDGRRLARYIVEADVKDKAEVIVPSQAVELILPNIKGDDNCSLTLAKNKMMIECGNVKICTKLIENTYPNYRQIIPSAFEKDLTVNRIDLISSLERVAVFATDGSTSYVELALSQDKMVLKSSSTVIGESRDELDVKFDTGEQMKIGLNPTFVMEALKALDEDDVVIQINGPALPLNFKRPDTDAFTYICMPYRIN